MHAGVPIVDAAALAAQLLQPKEYLRVRSSSPKTAFLAVGRVPPRTHIRTYTSTGIMQNQVLR